MLQYQIEHMKLNMKGMGGWVKVKYGKQEMRDYVVGSLESSKW